MKHLNKLNKTDNGLYLPTNILETLKDWYMNSDPEVRKRIIAGTLALTAFGSLLKFLGTKVSQA